MNTPPETGDPTALTDTERETLVTKMADAMGAEQAIARVPHDRRAGLAARRSMAHVALDVVLRELEYESLVQAARNTADDANRYFLAWQSARRRARTTPPTPAEVWDETLRWIRQQAEVTNPEYVLQRIDRAEPFNPYRGGGGVLTEDERLSVWEEWADSIAEGMTDDDVTSTGEQGADAYTIVRAYLTDLADLAARTTPLPKDHPLRCASCGDRATTTVILEGFRTPVCVRHFNVWRTPDWPPVLD